jgi:hypothetical protein
MPNKAKRFLSELPGGDEGFLYKNIASLAACEGARFLLLDREMFTVPRAYLLVAAAINAEEWEAAGRSCSIIYPMYRDYLCSPLL